MRHSNLADTRLT